MKLFLVVSFTTPHGDKVTDWLYLNRDKEEQWVCYNPWIGRASQGDIESVSHFSPDGIYLKEDDTVIALVRGIAIQDITIKFGDTGTGKIYSGMIPHPFPLDFKWESAPVPVSPPSTSAPSTPGSAVFIRPFTRP